MMYLRLEVKVCEACGALWLRRTIDGVYCSTCSTRLASFPAPNTRKYRGGRPRLPRAKGCAAARHTQAGAQ